MQENETLLSYKAFITSKPESEPQRHFGMAGQGQNALEGRDGQFIGVHPFLNLRPLSS